VFLNGVKLDKTDYTATSGTSIVLDSGASADDTLEILAFDTFGLFSGEFAQDVSVGGDLTASDDIKMTSDSAQITFGADSEVTLTHVADTGLTLKHTATADDKPINLTLATGETDMAANDVLGKISFQAPDEGTGTDAILVSGAVQARAEGDFSSSSNATSLDFMTGASEAATTKMTLTSAGKLGIGTTAPAYALEVNATAFQIAEFSTSNSGAGNIQIADGSTTAANPPYIGSVGDHLTFGRIGVAEYLRIQSGGGVSFNGDTAAANALDDYEEGTFTATLTAGTTAPSTPPTATGNYTKIGNLVNCRVVFNAVNTTGGAGYILVTGLPFSASSAGAYGDIMLHTMGSFSTTAANVATYIVGTSMVPYQSITTSGWATVTLNATSSGYLYFSATYPTAS